MSETARKRYALALTQIKSLRGRLGPLMMAGVEPGRLFQCSANELSESFGIERRLAERICQERGAVDVGREISRVKEAGAQVLCLLDREYPSALRRAPNPPPLLYLKGKLPKGAAVAVVGSRKASAYGLSAAEKIGRELGEAGVTVVSGLALGIDGAAHEAALAAGGPTIAVLGCGVDVCYPRRHARLAGDVVQSGCLISEQPLGMKPLSHHFPMRNRIISGLSLATVIVEAAANSGSLYTADFALAAGREVLAVPGNISSPTSEGTNALLADGAGPARCAEDIFDAIGLETPERATRRRERLSEREAAVLQLLGADPLALEDVVQQTGLAAPEVSTTMTLLEIKGVVRRGLDQRYMPVMT